MKSAAITGHQRKSKPRGNPAACRILADECFIGISNRKNGHRMSSVLGDAKKLGHMKAEKENCENSSLKHPVTPINMISSLRKQQSIDDVSTQCPS